MVKNVRKIVKGIKVGDEFELDGDLYIVKSFPSRSVVIGDIKEYCPGKPCSVKVSIKEIAHQTRLAI